MRLRTTGRLTAAVAALGLAGGGVLMAAAPAGAATYADTSLQASAALASSDSITASGAVLSAHSTGCTPSYTWSATGSVTPASGSGSPFTVTGGTGVVTLADGCGDLATVGVVSGAPGTPDNIALNTPADDNTTGNIDFSTVPAGGTVTEGNLPGGLVSGNPLVPGTAIPGVYYGVTDKATNPGGAVANGSLWLDVHGHKVTLPKVHPDFTGAISNFGSGKCLDNTNFRWIAGNGLQQWSCGAAGGVDQRFELHWTGSAYELLALDFAHPSDLTNWVVTSDGVTGHHLTIQPGSLTGTPPAGQLVIKKYAYYTFGGTAQVINNAGASNANGSWAISWPLVPGALNEQYSLP